MILFQLLCCHEHQDNPKENSANIVKKDSFKPIVAKKSIQVLNDSNFLKKPLVDCNLINSPEQKEEEDFLHSNIQFYQLKSLPDPRFINEGYCRFVLKNTNFLTFLESNFMPGNFEFTHFYTNVDHYGKCFVGRYYFPAADNSAQRRTVILLQIDKKELSILNFDDVKFVDGKLNCDFNVRGKHFVYNLKYSNECKRFVNYN